MTVTSTSTSFLASVSFTVHGIPAPQGSKRHVGHGRMIESSKKVGPWREAVRSEAQRAFSQPLTGPVLVAVAFHLPRPAGHFGARGLRPSAPAYPAVVPDLDKLVRSTLDGLVAGGAIADDKQVVSIAADKRYCASGSAPRADIYVTPMTTKDEA